MSYPPADHPRWQHALAWVIVGGLLAGMTALLSWGLAELIDPPEHTWYQEGYGRWPEALPMLEELYAAGDCGYNDIAGQFSPDLLHHHYLPVTIECEET
jgi:hypothetical protein